MSFEYVAKQTVHAAQWREDNLDEMKDLLRGLIPEDIDGEPCVYPEYIEPFYYASSNINLSHDGYYMLKTEFDEFDPGVWVVVYEDGEIEGMDNTQFHKMFNKV